MLPSTLTVLFLLRESFRCPRKDAITVKVALLGQIPMYLLRRSASPLNTLVQVGLTMHPARSSRRVSQRVFILPTGSLVLSLITKALKRWDFVQTQVRKLWFRVLFLSRLIGIAARLLGGTAPLLQPLRTRSVTRPPVRINYSCLIFLVILRVN